MYRVSDPHIELRSIEDATTLLGKHREMDPVVLPAIRSAIGNRVFYNMTISFNTLWKMRYNIYVNTDSVTRANNTLYLEKEKFGPISNLPFPNALLFNVIQGNASWFPCSVDMSPITDEARVYSSLSEKRKLEKVVDLLNSDMCAPSIGMIEFNSNIHFMLDVDCELTLMFRIFNNIKKLRKTNDCISVTMYKEKKDD